MFVLGAIIDYASSFFPDALVNGRCDQLVLQQIEEDARDRPCVPHQPHVHPDAGMVAHRHQRSVRCILEISGVKKLEFHFGPEAAVDHAGSVFGGGR